ncbi:MAG TPA: peptidylprolyl isomerase, partial [Thermoanaerobaculia bacterium]|nr:peptidylprolyl isomerase [Thermoanaerobaculia bacterium]
VYLARNASGAGPLSSELLSELFDEFLRERTLLRLAVDRGLVASDSDPRQAAESLLAHSGGLTPSSAEIKRYYEQHGSEFDRPERVHLWQILTSDRSVAARARKQILAGSKFEEVAKRISRDPSAPYGGDQGILAKSDLPSAFVAVIFDLKVGQVSKIVPAEYGYHLFEISKRWPAGRESLSEATPEIASRLRGERSKRMLARLAREAEHRYNVQVFRKNLPFTYRGSF